jgi:exodeoxyribonuclease X
MLIFFDTETTGNTKEDRLCQIAYKKGDETFEALFKPPIPISVESMAVCHITNKMVADKPNFQESDDYGVLKNLFEDPSHVPVAHNAVFDKGMLENENIKIPHFICTMRVARALDPEGKIPKYNLQYLRYFLDIEVQAIAHDALGDVIVLEKLFERLHKKVMETKSMNEEEAIKEMVEISSHPTLLKKIPFGKYAGGSIEEIAQKDRGYLEWLLNSKRESTQNEEDWIYTLEHYLSARS